MRTLVKNLVLPANGQVRTVLTGPSRGIRMNLDPRANDTRLWLGVFESELWPYVRRICRPGRTSFDIGGAQGFYALTFAKLTQAPVATFESDPACCEVIRSNMMLNPDISGLMQIHEQEVGRADGQGRTCLDTAADKTFQPDVIKMDIEGAEAAALEGASRVLDGVRPDLLIEVHGSDVEAQCQEILRSHGYRPTVVEPRRWFRENRPLAHNRWLVAEGATASRSV